MAGISKKEVRAILSSAEKQGCRVVPTTRGVKILHPDRVTILVVHWSTSDARAMKNLRADFRGSGLVWPFD